MPVAKKKEHQHTKHDSPIKTLEHFFKKPGPTPANKGQSNPDFPRSAPKPRAHNKPLQKAPKVIVIDPDDETGVPVTHTRTKKRKLSEDSDVEIIYVGPSVATTSFKRRNLSDSELKPTSGAAAVASISASKTFTFGVPSLLSGPTSHFKSPPATFGTAGSLLNSTASTSSGVLVSGPSAVKEETSPVDSNTQKDLPENPSYEWLMGDDEIDGTYAKDEDDDDEVEFVEDTLIEDIEPETGIDSCPCCEQQLLGLQPYVGIHLNTIHSYLFTARAGNSNPY